MAVAVMLTVRVVVPRDVRWRSAELHKFAHVSYLRDKELDSINGTTTKFDAIHRKISMGFAEDTPGSCRRPRQQKVGVPILRTFSRVDTAIFDDKSAGEGTS